MSRDPFGYCQECGGPRNPSNDWRAAGCPVEFRGSCGACGSSYRLIARLLPQFSFLPDNTRFDWHTALAHELFNAYQLAANREADLLGPGPLRWEHLDPTEKRVWLATYRQFLRRQVA